MTIRWEPTGRRYRGNGEVRQKGKFLAKVRYELSEMQGFFTTKQLGPNQPPLGQGQKQVRGTITVLDGEKWLDKYDSFELHMADSRVTQAKMVSRPQDYEPTFEVTVEFLE